MKLNGQSIHSQGGQTALDALLSNGVDVAHECKNGVCGACRCKSTGNAKQVKDALGYHAKGEVLLCCVSADSDIDVTVIL